MGRGSQTRTLALKRRFVMVGQPTFRRPGMALFYDDPGGDSMATPEGIEATVHARAVTGRRWAYAAWSTAGNGAVVAALGILAGGFVRPWLLLAGVALLVIATCLGLGARRLRLEAARRAGLNRYQAGHVEDWFVYPLEQLLAKHERSREWRTVAGVLVAFLGLYLTLPSVVAARAIGQPVRTKALAAADSDCFRCPANAKATFLLADGRTVTTSVVFTGQDDGSTFVAGSPLVYDAHHPHRAMTASAYDTGRSMAAAVVLIAAIAVDCVTVFWCVRTGMRRRWALGAGRPDVPITEIQRRAERGGDTLRVRFADGVVVDYLDQPLRREALVRRIAADPGGFSPPPDLASELAKA